MVKSNVRLIWFMLMLLFLIMAVIVNIKDGWFNFSSMLFSLLMFVGMALVTKIFLKSIEEK